MQKDKQEKTLSKADIQKQMSSDIVERECLAFAVTYPDKFINLINNITEDHFFFKEHRIIYGAIKNFYSQGKGITETLLIDYVVRCQVSFYKEIAIPDYIQTLFQMKKDSEYGFKEAFQRLQTLWVMRKLHGTTSKLIRGMLNDSANLKAKDIISMAEKTLSSMFIDIDSGDEEKPEDLYEGIEELIEEAGNNLGKDYGVLNPFQCLKHRYGDFKNGGLYMFVAPAKNGKSTLLMDISSKVAEDDNTKVLYLDTELKKDEVQYRIAGSMLDVNPAYLSTGEFRKDKAMTEKVRSLWPRLKAYLGRIDHRYVAGKPIDEIVTIIKKWYFLNKDCGKKLMVVFDYLKLTGETVSEYNKEYQVIGAKCTTLKNLAQELNLPILSAMQMNEMGKVASSSQIKWFADFVALFRRKTPEEIQEINDIDRTFGTHCLEVTESRSQGLGGTGHLDLIQHPKTGDFIKNKINFSMDNFNVTEVGDYKSMFSRAFGSISGSNDDFGMSRAEGDSNSGRGDDIPF